MEKDHVKYGYFSVKWNLSFYIKIYNLVNCLKEDQTCLDNFKIVSKNGERKIGKNIIAGLKEYLL